MVTPAKQPEVKFVCRSCSYSLPFRKVGFCPACGDPIDPTPEAKPKAKAKKKPARKKAKK